MYSALFRILERKETKDKIQIYQGLSDVNRPVSNPGRWGPKVRHKCKNLIEMAKIYQSYTLLSNL